MVSESKDKKKEEKEKERERKYGELIIILRSDPTWGRRKGKEHIHARPLWA